MVQQICRDICFYKFIARFRMDKEEFVADDLLECAVQFTSSPRFRDSIDDFIQAHVHIFYGTAASKSPDSEELPHEYNVIFGEYQKLVDSLFDQLARTHGFTTKALYRCFRDAGELLLLPLGHTVVSSQLTQPIRLTFLLLLASQRIINLRHYLKRTNISGSSTRS